MRAFLYPGALFVSFPTPSSAAKLQREQFRHFTAEEQALIRAYYEKRETGKTVVSARGRKLAAGEQLAPQAVKRLLPQALDAQLPELEPEFDRVIVDGRVLLIDIHSELIQDVIPDLYIEL